MGWIGGNVFEAPHLPKDMLEQEKLFISIEVWEGDGFVIAADNLDEGTQETLAEKPDGKGRYFSWDYLSPEDSEKQAAAAVKKKGYTTSSGRGVLTVTRLGGWKKIEDAIHDKWSDEGLWD